MKIITDDYEENCVTLENLQAEYTQDADCCEDSGTQSLSISTRNGGGGSFYHIKTEGWSFDKIDNLIDVLNDFKKRFIDAR
jgi:hypothetical protein